MQLKISKTIEFFGTMISNKFKLTDYVSNKKPTLFFGVYSRGDVSAIVDHKGPKIIWFAGTDACDKNMLESIKPYIDDKTIVIAESRWIEDDLKLAGIKYESLPTFIDDTWKWKPEELGDSIYWYGGKNSRYGKQYVQQIQNAFPNTEIIMTDINSYKREEMPSVYKKCFCGIRILGHDGMSQTVGEMALMGRMSIWNGNGPFALNYNGIEDVINHIKKLKEGYNPYLIAKRSRGHFFTSEQKWVDIVLSLFGTDEIDSTNIFEDSIDRCGSMFRIQRKSDIEKIGGLGTEQFERPWFSQKMQELGKRQLITTKSSGWTSKEWKGGENKGYPKGTEFYTYDKKYD